LGVTPHLVLIGANASATVRLIASTPSRTKRAEIKSSSYAATRRTQSEILFRSFLIAKTTLWCPTNSTLGSRQSRLPPSAFDIGCSALGVRHTAGVTRPRDRFA